MSHIAWPFGVGLALVALEASLFNRCIFPRSELVCDADLQEACAWLSEHANTARALDLSLAKTPRIVEIAESLGWRAGNGGLVRFGRGPAPVAPPSCEFDVVEIDAARGDDFARVGQQWFGLPEPFRPLLKPVVGRAGWRTYLALEGTLTVACATMRLTATGAWLGMGATHPDYRRRGAQNALLARRLRDGIAAGIDLFTVATDRPADGDEPGASFRNILRAGFSVSHESRYFTRH
jgi:hypothetical protein